MSEPPICEAFLIAAFFAEQDGVAPINSLPGCYERQIDDQWFIAINGHEAVRETKGRVSVEPYHMYVEFNGWPAGHCTPYDGVFAAGAIANVGAFIAACEKALGKTSAELQADLTGEAP